MLNSYWMQWSHAELMSMHGVEIDDQEHDTDLDHDEDDTDSDQDEEESMGCSARSPCSNCMDCLGMSWRDFM